MVVLLYRPYSHNKKTMAKTIMNLTFDWGAFVFRIINLSIKATIILHKKTIQRITSKSRAGFHYDLIGQKAIAEFIGISDETLKRWKKKSPQKYTSIKIFSKKCWRANSQELKEELERWAY